VGERERELLRRRRPRFANVVAADRDRVPHRHLARAKGHHVGDDAERRAGRIDVGAAGDVLLEDVVLQRARQWLQRDALAARDRSVQREQDDRGGIDRHRRRHPIERNPAEQRVHVLDGIDGDADAAHLARCERVIRVVADLRGQIEGDAQPRDAVIEQIAKALVGFRRRREARVLPHRPGTAAVHVRLNAASERECAGGADVSLEIGVDEVVRRREGPCLGARGHRRRGFY
jgi:hypothetical protein